MVAACRPPIPPWVVSFLLFLLADWHNKGEEESKAAAPPGGGRPALWCSEISKTATRSSHYTLAARACATSSKAHDDLHAAEYAPLPCLAAAWGCRHAQGLKQPETGRQLRRRDHIGDAAHGRELQLAAVEVQVRDATQALGLNDLTSLAQPLGVRVVHQSGELRFDTEVDCQGSFSPACNASNGSVSSKPFADAIYAAVSDATPEPLSTPAPRLR